MVEGIARSSFVTTYNQPLTKKTPFKALTRHPPNFPSCTEVVNLSLL